MQLRELRDQHAIRVSLTCVGAMSIVSVVTLSRLTIWQNSIRDRMHMPEVDSSYPIGVVATAIIVAIVLLVIARGLWFLVHAFSARLKRIMPPRVALVLSGTVWTILIFTFVNGFIVKAALRGMDYVFAAINEATYDGLTQPTDSTSSGSQESLVRWSEIGKNGKLFVTGGPTAVEIAALTGRIAKQPVRVYVGFNTTDSAEERARIALQELIRVGGFDRKVLIIATPTGTGWLDPSAVDPVEYVHDGDIATVSAQYSYLPSWLTLVIDPERSRHEAQVLFREVYSYWTQLPKDHRPRLYLFGLSLGALGTEVALDFCDFIGDPIHGAVLAGPPFPSTT